MNGNTPDMSPKARKKPYAAPKLISYGHVKDIVQTGGGGMGDGSGTCKTQCWIAEVLYGIEHPRTLLLRARLRILRARKEPGWVFAELYGRIGWQVASLIRWRLLPRSVFLPLFDRLTDWALDEWPRILRDGRLRRAV